MSTHAMLIQSLKHNELKQKAAAFKLTLLLVVSSVISGCYGIDCRLTATSTGETYNCPTIGGSDIPVNYISPVAGQVFNNINLAFEVEFPDANIPSNVEIRINGAIVTSDFDETSATTFEVPVVSSGASPLVWGALRDGANTFQVTSPAKGMITFFVDFDNPRIHILSVDDGWNGVTQKVVRGNNFHNKSGYGMYSTYKGNRGDFKDAYPVTMSTVNGLNVANKFQPFPKRGDIVIQGYVEGEEYAAISSLQVQTYALSGTGAPTPNTGAGTNMLRAAGTSLYQTMTVANDRYLVFGEVDKIDLFHFEGAGLAADTRQDGYDIPSEGWTTNGSAGISNNDSIASPATTNGTKLLYLWGNASTTWAEKTFTVPAGKQDSYVLSFLAAQNTSNAVGANRQHITLEIDGQIIGKLIAADATYQAYSFRTPKLTAGAHTLRISVPAASPAAKVVLLDRFQLVRNFDFSIRAHDTGDHDIYNASSNTTAYSENEADQIKITVCKTALDVNKYGTNLCSPRTWLRSNIPLNNQRLGKGGGFSIAFDQVSFLSTGAGVLDLIEATDLGSTPSDPGTGTWVQKLTVLPPNHPIPGTPLANKEGIFLTLPTQPNPGGAVSRLKVQARLDIDLFITVTLISSWAPIVCDVQGTKTEVHNGVTYSDVARVDYTANVDISVDGAGNTVVDLTSPTLNLASINACSLNVADLANGVQDAINPIIRNSIGGIFANDLPTTRLSFGITTPLGDQLGPFFLPVQPTFAKAVGKQKTGGIGSDWDNKWVLDMGVHMRGVVPKHALSAPFVNDYPAAAVTRNVSLGTTFSGQQLSPASMNEDPSGLEADDAGTSLAVTLSEDFINQLFMGLWESGFLYIDFDIESPAMSNPFLTNVNFAFASTQPWTVDIADTVYGDSQPNFKITIPDLLINLSGDRYFPAPTSQECIDNGQASNCSYLAAYEFARMLGDVVLYTEVTPSPDQKSLRLRLTQALEVDVTEVSSDWDDISEEQLAVALDAAFNLLTGGGAALDLPFPIILTSTTQIKEVETDSHSVYVMVDVYNSSCFPAGPDLPALIDWDCASDNLDVIWNWPDGTLSLAKGQTLTNGDWTITNDTDGFTKIKVNGATLVKFGNAATTGNMNWQGDSHLVGYDSGGSATWVQGNVIPNGIGLPHLNTPQNLILLSDGRLLIYELGTHTVRHTFAREPGTLLPLVAGDFSSLNTGAPYNGLYDSLVNNVDDTGGASFHLDVPLDQVVLGQFEDMTCPLATQGHLPANWWNEEQRARKNGAMVNGNTITFNWNEPGVGARAIGLTVNGGTTTVAEVQAAFNSVLGAGKVTVSGDTWTGACSGWLCSDSDQNMYFKFVGYAGNVDEMTVTENFGASVNMATTYGGPSGSLGSAPFTGGNNYCYGAYNAQWPSTVTAATGSNFGVNAPQGSYVMVLQGTATASRTFTVPTTGPYLLTFRAAQRDNGSNQAVTVKLNGTTIVNAGTALKNPSYATYSKSLALTAGQTYTLSFTGNPPTGDHSMFIDDIAVTPVVDKGFKVDIGADRVITEVILDGRNDCCTTRIDGLKVQLYKDGVKVYEADAIAGAVTGFNTISIPYVVADEVRLIRKGGTTLPNGYTINFSEFDVRAL